MSRRCGTVGVMAYLVNGRDGLPALCQFLQDDLRAVGNSDSFDFTTSQDSLHLSPSLGLIPFGIDVSGSVLFEGHDGGCTVRDQSAGPR